MTGLLSDLLFDTAECHPQCPALRHKEQVISYEQLARVVESVSSGLLSTGLGIGDRIAVYLPKIPETVVALFAVAHAGCTFVPVNPVLKPEQVGYILRDCNVRILVTSKDRANPLAEVLPACSDLYQIILVDGDATDVRTSLGALTLSWEAMANAGYRHPFRRIDSDIVSILYTSGSTGRPKGVVLSHRNMVAGAIAVNAYLDNVPDDRLLAALPFSFDYGLSQLTMAFHKGASVVLMDYLLPRDVIRAVDKYAVTGLAAVPPLWNQLAALDWTQCARESLRYITNSGGAMPLATTQALRRSLPNTRVYLMYGLTEAFRSTYLPPAEIDRRPDSMGKAIPNAQVFVVREDGSECAPGEPGELVHRGVHVTMGYWNDPEKTAERFRAAPNQPKELSYPETAVWSGDQVRRDEDGFFYFIGRNDEMIKTSGYRVSPSEIEEVVYGHGGVAQAVAFGVPHPVLGQGIVLVIQSLEQSVNEQSLLEHCRRHLPQFMVPGKIDLRDSLPRNANGKIDRRLLCSEFQDVFENE